jgi:chloramphenicol 3-O phosphotransferase
MSTIIFLNGCASSGKTTVARAIQYLDHKPWLRFGLDTFMDMLPDQYTHLTSKSHDGYLSFKKDYNSFGSTLTMDMGPLGAEVFDQMPAIANILAHAGNNMIIDEVLLGDHKLKAYINALKDHTVYFIAIVCELVMMQKREHLRLDKPIGIVHDQILRVHDGLRTYDFTIDTSFISPFESAKLALDFIQKNDHPTAFKNLALLINETP